MISKSGALIEFAERAAGRVVRNELGRGYRGYTIQSLRVQNHSSGTRMALRMYQHRSPLYPQDMLSVEGELRMANIDAGADLIVAEMKQLIDLVYSNPDQVPSLDGGGRSG